tara:strand:+ start:262 stop:498 length:237 start_codon:yes stop_codon:yes gene_type:complete
LLSFGIPKHLPLVERLKDPGSVLEPKNLKMLMPLLLALHLTLSVHNLHLLKKKISLLYSSLTRAEKSEAHISLKERQK